MGMMMSLLTSLCGFFETLTDSVLSLEDSLRALAGGIHFNLCMIDLAHGQLSSSFPNGS